LPLRGFSILKGVYGGNKVAGKNHKRGKKLKIFFLKKEF